MFRVPGAQPDELEISGDGSGEGDLARVALHTPSGMCLEKELLRTRLSS